MDGSAKLEAATAIIFGLAGVFRAMAAFVSWQSRVAARRNGFYDKNRPDHLEADISGDAIGSIQADSLLFTNLFSPILCELAIT